MSEQEYMEKTAAYNRRYGIGIKECYAWCARTGKKPDIGESAEYAEKFAGPKPHKEQRV
jgi:hypothetical protein